SAAPGSLRAPTAPRRRRREPATAGWGPSAPASALAASARRVCRRRSTGTRSRAEDRTGGRCTKRSAASAYTCTANRRRTSRSEDIFRRYRTQTRAYEREPLLEFRRVPLRSIGGPGIPPRPDGAPSAQAGTGDAGLGPFRTRLGSLVLDTGRLTVEVDGEEVHLTPTELRVLLLLTEQPEHVYSREKIAFTVWGYEWAGDSRVVDVHIQRLRKKIGASMIETVRGFGYRFAG